MDQLNQKLRPLNRFGDQIPQLKDVARGAGVETGVIVGAALLVTLLITFAMFGSAILTLSITVIYPSIKSIQALESHGTQDDKEWLTYWIIFGLFSLVDDCCGCILNFIPYFFWIKLAFFIYLLAPQTRGALSLYNSVVRDLLEKNRSKIEGLINDVKGSVKEVSSEAKKAAREQLSDPQNLMKAAQVASEAQRNLEKLE